MHELISHQVPDDSLLRSKMFVSQEISGSPTKTAPAEPLYRPTSHEDVRSPQRARGVSQPPGVTISTQNIPATVSSEVGAFVVPLSTMSYSAQEDKGLRGSFNRLAVSIKSAFGSSRNMNEPKVVKVAMN